MTGTTREEAWNALYTLLSSDAGVKGQIQSFSRRFMMPSKIKTEDAFQLAGGKFPILMLREEDEDTKVPGLTPPIRTWQGWVVVYFENTNKKVAGATLLNPIIDAIESAIDTLTGTDFLNGRQTLGNLVWRCWVEGTTVKETGDTDPSGFGGCAIPIKIKVP